MNAPESFPSPWSRSSHGRLRASKTRFLSGMTLLEVMIAMTLFIVATVGFTGAYYSLNLRAARLRCDAAAAAILRAKIAKDMTDPWVSQSTPVDCVVTGSSIQTTADPSDPYDVGPTVTLLSSSDSPGTGVVTGTLYRNTYTFESASDTVAIDYKLVYTFRNTTYTDYASTIRARDY